MKKRLDDFRTKTEAIDYIVSQEHVTRSDAEKILTREIPKESYYQTKIIRFLKERYPKAVVWKAAAGPYSVSGIPDVCMILDGRFYGFEVKRPFVGSPSKMQLFMIKKIRSAGGVAGIVTSIREAEELIREVNAV